LVCASDDTGQGHGVLAHNLIHAVRFNSVPQAIDSNERLILYIDDHSGIPDAYAGLMDFIRLHRRFCVIGDQRLQALPFEEIHGLEAGCKREHDWKTDEWFLDLCAYDRLGALAEDSNMLFEEGIVEWLRFRMHEFAHPMRKGFSWTPFRLCRRPKMDFTKPLNEWFDKDTWTKVG
jgi:hypothetical protein